MVNGVQLRKNRRIQLVMRRSRVRVPIPAPLFSQVRGLMPLAFLLKGAEKGAERVLKTRRPLTCGVDDALSVPHPHGTEKPSSTCRAVDEGLSVPFRVDEGLSVPFRVDKGFSVPKGRGQRLLGAKGPWTRASRYHGALTDLTGTRTAACLPAFWDIFPRLFVSKGREWLRQTRKPRAPVVVPPL